MTSADKSEFTELFENVALALGLKAKGEERSRMQALYFYSLQRFSLDDVKTAAAACIRTMRFFPRAAEWRALVMHGPRLALPTLTNDDIAERLEAEHLHWERPCQCQACVEAGIGDRPSQYLPTHASGDFEGMAINPSTKAATWKGAWLHGEALARWYAARADFWNTFHEMVGTVKMDAATRRREAKKEPI